MTRDKKKCSRFRLHNSLQVLAPFLFGCCDNRDERLVLTALVELHNAIAQCEQGMILAHSDVAPRIMFGTALTNYNVASNALLTTKYLNTKSFAFRFTAVTRTTDTFFMSHNFLILKFEI